MQDWQQRVVDEARELMERKDRLHEFMQTEAFLNLSSRDKDLLDLQHYLMMAYARVLTTRIARFTGV